MLTKQDLVYLKRFGKQGIDGIETLANNFRQNYLASESVFNPIFLFFLLSIILMFRILNMSRHLIYTQGIAKIVWIGGGILICLFFIIFLVYSLAVYLLFFRARIVYFKFIFWKDSVDSYVERYNIYMLQKIKHDNTRIKEKELTKRLNLSPVALYNYQQYLKSNPKLRLPPSILKLSMKKFDQKINRKLPTKELQRTTKTLENHMDDFMKVSNLLGMLLFSRKNKKGVSLKKSRSIDKIMEVHTYAL